jgi:site-specific DNA-methyltransferase (adenine-specific)
MSEKTFKIINGNSYEELKKFPDNYFDSVVTDPPYGLGKEPNATEMLKAWVENSYMEVKGGGFMGKEWDSFVPQPLFWKEVFRVLKHGGHIVAFYGTRTYDWGVMAMRLAGFEIRDSIQWCYGSGFPKSHNISKAIDKMYGAEREVIGKSKYTIPKADNTMGENSYGISGGKLANGTTAE